MRLFDLYHGFWLFQLLLLLGCDSFYFFYDGFRGLRHWLRGFSFRGFDFLLLCFRLLGN
jgi:hypothetical protein